MKVCPRIRIWTKQVSFWVRKLRFKSYNLRKPSIQPRLQGQTQVEAEMWKCGNREHWKCGNPAMWNRQTTPLSEADFLSFVVLNHILILILLYFFITLVLTTTLCTLLIALLPGVTVPPSSVMSQFVCSFTDPTSLRRVRKLLRHCGGKTGQVRTEFCTRV